MADLLSAIQSLNQQKFGLPTEADVIAEGQRLDAEKQLERENYLRLVAEDKVGIQPFSFLFGLDTQNPDALVSKYVAPADVVPTSFLTKAGIGLLSGLGAGLLGRKMLQNPPGPGTLGMNMYHGTSKEWTSNYPDPSENVVGVFGPGVYFGGTPSVSEPFGDIIYKFDFPDEKISQLAEYYGTFFNNKKLNNIFKKVKKNFLDGASSSFSKDSPEKLEYVKQLLEEIEFKVTDDPGYTFGNFTKHLDQGMSNLLGDRSAGRAATTKLLSDSGASGASFEYGLKEGLDGIEPGEGFVVWDTNILNKMPIQETFKKESNTPYSSNSFNLKTQSGKISFKQAMRNWVQNKQIDVFRIGKKMLFPASMVAAGAASATAPIAALVGLNQEFRDAWVNDPKLQGKIPLSKDVPPVMEYVNKALLDFSRLQLPDEAKYALDQKRADYANMQSKLKAIYNE